MLSVSVCGVRNVLKFLK